MNPFEVERDEELVDVPREFVGGPIFLAVEGCDVEFGDWMAMEVDQRVVTLDPDRCIVTRDGKSEDASMKIHLTCRCSKKLDTAFDSNARAVHVLPIGSVEACTVDLLGQERDVHVFRSHNGASMPVSADEGPSLASWSLVKADARKPTE